MSNDQANEQAREKLGDAIAEMNVLPDISGKDSERLQGFMRMTAVEIKAVRGVGAATSLEMIGYMRQLEHDLSSRDAEIREVLEGLRYSEVGWCWCKGPGRHSKSCEAARALWSKLQPKESSDV